MNRYKIGDKVVNSKKEEGIIIDFIMGSKTVSRKAEVRFSDGTVVTVPTSKLKSGSFKNPNSPSVCGVGFIGKGKYYSSKAGIPVKAYRVWEAMIYRCYGKNKQNSYKDCVVCDEWLNYQKFAEWYSAKNESNLNEYDLDKDLLGNSKLYSPETCCLIHGSVNRSLSSYKSISYRKSNGKYIVSKGGDSFYVSSEGIAKDIVLSLKINKLYILIRNLKVQKKSDPRIMDAVKDMIKALYKEQEELRKELLNVGDL